MRSTCHPFDNLSSDVLPLPTKLGSNVLFLKQYKKERVEEECGRQNNLHCKIDTEPSVNIKHSINQLWSHPAWGQIRISPPTSLVNLTIQLI